jgi:transposase
VVIDFHGNWQGLSPGNVMMVWLSHIISKSDHRMNQVEEWSKKREKTLERCLEQEIRHLDFTDDRLSIILQTLANDESWSNFEQSLNKHLIRVYDFSNEPIRIDSTTASGYWRVDEDGMFQLGYSKDKRPDLPQVKVNMSTLDPLGMPLVTQILPGNAADDPLYIPAINEIKKSFDCNGLLFVGDCKMSAINTRATVDNAGDFYLCPLSALQFSKEQLDKYLCSFDDDELIEIFRTDSEGERSFIAEGIEQSENITANINGEKYHWKERRLIVRSEKLRKAEEKAFDNRFNKAQSNLARVTRRKKGKKNLESVEEVMVKVEEILKKNRVIGLFQCHIQEIQKTRIKRRYGNRPAQEIIEKDFILSFEIDTEATEQARKRLGWRIYATNHCSQSLPLEKAVLAYRNEYIVERGFARLKGQPLSLRPTYLTRIDHVTGLIRLLSIALRVICLLEFVVRKNLEVQVQELAGLYAGNPKRSTTRPTTESILRAFKDIDFSVVQLPRQTIVYITPLSELQQNILLLLEFPVDLYKRLSCNLLN